MNRERDPAIEAQLRLGSIRAVVFDLRGTLVDPASGWRLTDRERIRFLRSHGAQATESELQSLIDQAVAWVNALALRRTSYFEQDRLVLERVAERVGVHIPAASLGEFERWRNHAFVRTVRAYADAEPALRGLRERGLATGCVADGGRHWTELVLERCRLTSLLDVAVASQESGEVKATGAALQLACSRLRLEPGQVLYVGDRIDKDIRVAERVGAVPLLLARGPAPESEASLQISSLGELLTLPFPSRTRSEEARCQSAPTT